MTQDQYLMEIASIMYLYAEHNKDKTVAELKILGEGITLGIMMVVSAKEGKPEFYKSAFKYSSVDNDGQSKLPTDFKNRMKDNFRV